MRDDARRPGSPVARDQEAGVLVRQSLPESQHIQWNLERRRIRGIGLDRARRNPYGGREGIRVVSRPCVPCDIGCRPVRRQPFDLANAQVDCPTSAPPQMDSQVGAGQPRRVGNRIEPEESDPRCQLFRSDENRSRRSRCRRGERRVGRVGRDHDLPRSGIDHPAASIEADRVLVLGAGDEREGYDEQESEALRPPACGPNPTDPSCSSPRPHQSLLHGWNPSRLPLRPR